LKLRFEHRAEKECNDYQTWLRAAQIGHNLIKTRPVGRLFDQDFFLFFREINSFAILWTYEKKREQFSSIHLGSNNRSEQAPKVHITKEALFCFTLKFLYHNLTAVQPFSRTLRQHLREFKKI